MNDIILEVHQEIFHINEKDVNNNNIDIND